VRAAQEVVIDLGTRHGFEVGVVRLLISDGTRLVKIRDWDPRKKQLNPEPDYVTSLIDGLVCLHYVGDDEPRFVGPPKGHFGPSLKRCSPTPEERATLTRLNEAVQNSPVAIREDGEK